MKPYVICHMVSSVDGRILPDRWHPPLPDRSLYERLHDEIGSDVWLVGRVTGQEFASCDTPYPPATGTSLGRQSWFARKNADAWAVVLDAGERSPEAAATWAVIRWWSYSRRPFRTATSRGCARMASPARPSPLAATSHRGWARPA
jgi:hypothetical protein